MTQTPNQSLTTEGLRPFAVALADLRALVLSLGKPGQVKPERLQAEAKNLEDRIEALKLSPEYAGLEQAFGRTLETLRPLSHSSTDTPVDEERLQALSQEGAACYEDLRRILVARGVSEVVRSVPRRISHHNPFRSVFHAATGLVAAYAYRYVVDFSAALAIAVGASLLGAGLELFRRRSGGFNAWFMKLGFVRKVARTDEHQRIWSSTYFAWGVTAAVVLCSPLAVQVGCVVLAIGDPAASMVGRHAGGPKLLEAKSVGGSLAFLVFGGLAALAFLCTTSDLPFVAAAAIAFASSLVGAVAELLSRQVDDNLTIPIAASLAAYAASAIWATAV